MNRRLYSLAFLLICCGQVVSQVNGGLRKYGFFEGRLALSPLQDGVHWEVREPFAYSDFNGHKLVASKGFATDGASTPRWLWSPTGWTPFSGGNYASAAVIHDVGCDRKKYSWMTTDRLFYDAMIDSKTEPEQAKLMYYAVLVFGPHWKLIQVAGTSDDDAALKLKSLGAEVVSLPIHFAGTGAALVGAPPYPPAPTKKSDLDHLRKELKLRADSGNPMSAEEVETVAMKRVPPAPVIPPGAMERNEDVQLPIE